ncbi:hypothetical protein GNF10_00815 [Nostoc sp. UCD121]|uniref:hypothetical protein n=1 Tax=Nostoc sp. UCD121 TaxID=2681305 RepID=UPI00162A288B|nr:hypothetical protein [Nostoc sp. UCD121]MBC1223826.1 hypothetical protein [Nostoc sp. UCD120]MBC1274556.1 hypothetical protein [Nostoc sp. UCD121]MBC1297289.1 hypothetical protein [Nostoc sp. UCD122]
MSNQEEQYNIAFLVQQLCTNQDNAVLKQTAKHSGFIVGLVHLHTESVLVLVSDKTQQFLISFR